MATSIRSTNARPCSGAPYTTQHCKGDNEAMATKFLVFTDLHVDIMHDSVARMQVILNAARKANVDFILHLGDIMYPEETFVSAHAPEDLDKRAEGWFLCDRDDEKLAIRDMLQKSGVPVHSVLGNHDMDSCNKAVACRYWDIPAPHYDFVEGGVRFLALDSQYIRRDGQLIDFEYCNYKNIPGSDVHFIPQDQLQWLEETVMASEEPCVLLSHAALGDDLLSVTNRQEVWDVISRVNRDRRRVIAAFNGHNHADGLAIRRGVPFMSVNSASNIWIGMKYATTRYSETICKIYPHLRGTAPYYSALYAVVTIDDENILVEGVDSSYVGPSPQALGMAPAEYYHEPAPVIRSRRIPIRHLDGEGKTDLYQI